MFLISDEKMKTAEKCINIKCETKFLKLGKFDQDKALESLNGENWLNDDAIGMAIFQFRILL